MPSKAVQQLLEEGQRSGLFSTAAAQELIAQLTTDDTLTADELIERMIGKKVLTAYQAEQLRAGHGAECLVAGRYRILEKLGEGGMGAVFRAHDSQLDRDVAVKVLPAQRLNDADAIARFQREARALAKLSHPNIIQAYDNGVDKGRHFLVLEYVEGASLSAILREQGAIPPTLASDMIYQAALGLQHAHGKGLVHRDVKPANLLLSRAQPLAGVAAQPARDLARLASQLTTSYVAPAGLGKGIVKVLDLGLARFLQDQLGDSQLTKEGIGVGTPDYMAPEQFRDALHADARTDIYGLGCTLYQLVTGAVPFPGSSFSEKADAHAKKEPIPVEERCPEVPAGLAFVISKMMSKHPADRFQTAAEVAEALAPYVAGASHSMILLRQTMRFHAGQLTMRAPNRRKRLLAWSGGILAAACFVGLFILAWPSIFLPQTTEAGSNGPPAVPNVITIENGLTVAKDGTGQFTTIGEALKIVKPGQTIRVLDGGTYEESVHINNPVQYDRITLEAVQKATIKGPAAALVVLLVQGVPNVTVRGFRLDLGEGQTQYLSGILRRCPGLVFDGLEFVSSRRVSTCGISVETIEISKNDPPVSVRNCTVRGFTYGVRVEGLVRGKPESCQGVIIQQNNVFNCDTGIWAAGLLKDVYIAANRVWGCGISNIELAGFAEGSSSILVANNTLKDLRQCLIIREPIRMVQGVEVWRCGTT